VDRFVTYTPMRTNERIKHQWSLMSRVISRFLVAPALAECDIRCESVRTKAVRAVSLAVAHVRSSRHQTFCVFWLKSLQLHNYFRRSTCQPSGRTLSRGYTHRETRALPYAWSRCKLTRFMGHQSIHGLTDCDFHRKRIP
jgi:hypothetical protein